MYTQTLFLQGLHTPLSRLSDCLPRVPLGAAGVAAAGAAPGPQGQKGREELGQAKLGYTFANCLYRCSTKMWETHLVHKR